MGEGNVAFAGKTPPSTEGRTGGKRNQKNRMMIQTDPETVVEDEGRKKFVLVNTSLYNTHIPKTMKIYTSTTKKNSILIYKN